MEIDKTVLSYLYGG